MQEIYTPEEALIYLREQRGIIFSSAASLRRLRKRGQAHSDRVKKRTTLWTKAELDAIQPTSRTKRVQEGENDENNGRALSVTPHEQQTSSSAVAA